MGALREHHYRTRDAVIQHYMELHPQDFDHFNDSGFSCRLPFYFAFVSVFHSSWLHQRVLEQITVMKAFLYLLIR